MQLELIALSSAFFYAAGNVASRVALRRHASQFSALVTIFSGTAILWMLVLIAGHSLPSSSSIALFALRGVIDPGITALLVFIALRRIGASLTIPIIAASSLVSTALSVLLLGESLTAAIVAGTLLIVIGVWLLAFRMDSLAPSRKYVLVALAASVLIGFAAVVTKLALNLSSNLEGGLAVSFSAALFAQIIVTTFIGKWKEVPLGWKNARLFLLAGIFVAAAFFLNFAAFAGGFVSIVFPLISTQPLFALILTAILLRGYERITRNTIVGTVTIVAGAALLSIA